MTDVRPDARRRQRRPRVVGDATSRRAARRSPIRTAPPTVTALAAWLRSAVGCRARSERRCRRKTRAPRAPVGQAAPGPCSQVPATRRPTAVPTPTAGSSTTATSTPRRHAGADHRTDEQAAHEAAQQPEPPPGRSTSARSSGAGGDVCRGRAGSGTTGPAYRARAGGRAAGARRRRPPTTSTPLDPARGAVTATPGRRTEEGLRRRDAVDDRRR